MKKKHYITFSLLTFLTLGLMKAVYQIPSKESTSSLTRDILRINLQEGNPLTLHPHRAVVKNSRILGNALFERLLRINEKGLPELAAAEKMEISPDQKTYTFTIRPHVWSNGQPVTAYHFESAWKRALSPDEPCSRVDLFYIIKNAKAAKKGGVPMEQIGVHALNEKTFIVELEHPNPFFPDLLTNLIFSPLFDLENAIKVVNGPFQLETWQPDSTLKLMRNPLYWDIDSVKLSGIVFSMVKDPNVALALFEQGEIDWIGNPFSNLPVDILSYNTCHSQPFTYKDVVGTYWITINTEKIPFTSVKIRKALSCALDRKSLTDNVLIAQTPHKSPVPKNVSLLEENDCYLDADPEGALQLFEEGLKELELTRETCPPLLLTYGDVPGYKNLAEVLQQAWQKAFTIPVKLQGYDWNMFIAQLQERKLQLGGCMTYSTCSDPLSILEMFKEKEHPMNCSNWENEQFARCLDLARTKTTEKERNALLKKAEKILLEELPVIPIYSGRFIYMTNDQLEGILLDNCGHVDFRKMYFKN